MKISARGKHLAFTLAEMLVSIGCGVLILAAVVAAGVSLQRSYAAIEAYSNTESDQLRVLDYIAMDCRRATTATVTTVSNIPVLTLTVPNFYDPCNSNVPVAPVLVSGVVTYKGGSNVDCGSVTNTTATIKYTRSGNNFTREVISQKSDGTTSDVTTAIAKNVSTFTVNDTDLTNWVTVSIMFFPTFLHNAGSGTWRSGLNNPDTAPASSVGSDGDWYVINTTATDPTTIGNVYFRSGGTYSLVQNEKATTVACKTFLRNAVARN
jgi:type II secretory pathway component PulJ